MGLSAGLSTTVPDPVGNDGTTLGLTDPESSTLPPDIEVILESFATFLAQVVTLWILENFWPRLHSMFTKTSLDGPMLSLHISVDLLGNMKIEELDFNSGTFNDPIQTTEFGNNLFLTFTTDFLSTWSLTISAWIVGFMVGRFSKSTTLQGMTVAIVLLATYVVLVISDLAATAARAVTLDATPAKRFMLILVKGLLALFGWTILSLLLPYKWSQYKEISTDFGKWVSGNSDLSWMFIGVKFALTLITFVLACAVGGFSVSGLF